MHVLAAADRCLAQRRVCHNARALFLHPEDLFCILTCLSFFLAALFGFALLFCVKLLLAGELFSFFLAGEFFFSAFLDTFFVFAPAAFVTFLVFLTETFTALFVCLSALFITLFVLFPASFAVLSVSLRIGTRRLINISARSLYTVYKRSFCDNNCADNHQHQQKQHCSDHAQKPVQRPGKGAGYNAAAQPLFGAFQIQIPDRIIHRQSPLLKQERADYTKQEKQDDSRRQLHGCDPVSLIGNAKRDCNKGKYRQCICHRAENTEHYAADLIADDTDHAEIT